MTLSVKSDEGQKQVMSLLDLQSGIRLSQVLIHLGTTLGQEVVGTGASGVEVGLASAGTEIVEDEVRMAVEVVVYVVTTVEPPVVMVSVTGQVVTVS
jgi:hypothetical protein